MNTIEGIIFDWDGVIVDSAFAHEKSWELLAQENQLTLPEGHFKRWFGIPSRTIIKDYLKLANNDANVFRLCELKEHYYQKIIQETGLQVLPGVFDFLETLKIHGIKTAVGTSTSKANLESAFSLLGLKKYFNAYVCIDDVVEGKPHPEVFLKAAKALDCEPFRCVVIEDAPQGINAGLTAGMFVLGLTTTRLAEKLIGAHMIRKNLSQVTLEDILSAFSGQLNIIN